MPKLFFLLSIIPWLLGILFFTLTMSEEIERSKIGTGDVFYSRSFFSTLSLFVSFFVLGFFKQVCFVFAVLLLVYSYYFFVKRAKNFRRELKEGIRTLILRVLLAIFMSFFVYFAVGIGKELFKF